MFQEKRSLRPVMVLFVVLVMAYTSTAVGSELQGSITFGWKGTLEAMEITETDVGGLQREASGS